MFPKPQKFFVGAKVISAAGWTGVVVRRIKKDKSSPWVVKWDKNGLESRENSMSVKIIENHGQTN